MSRIYATIACRGDFFDSAGSGVKLPLAPRPLPLAAVTQFWTFT